MKERIAKRNELVEKNKAQGVSGLDAYIAEDSDESSDSFEDNKENEGGGSGSLMGEVDPRKLVDMDLVNLLRYCKELND